MLLIMIDICVLSIERTNRKKTVRSECLSVTVLRDSEEEEASRIGVE